MTEATAQEQLRAQVRAVVRASGLKQKWIAEKLGLSEKHLSQLLTGRITLTLTWAEGILGLCGHSLVIGTRPDEQDAA